MTRIFVNLPVRDLERSKAFFAALGFGVDPRFTDATAACVVIGDAIFAMLLTHEKFTTFSPKPIADATRSAQVLLALTCPSRAAVDEMVAKAVGAGGSTYQEPQDHGFMYAHGFMDPDGHIWEPFWMDPAVAG
jgi:predicted lactoylglutathione lyase